MGAGYLRAADRRRAPSCGGGALRASSRALHTRPSASVEPMLRRKIPRRQRYAEFFWSRLTST
jgi:hypothetical protein